MKPTDMFRVFWQLVTTLTAKVPPVHVPWNTTPLVEEPYSEPTVTLYGSTAKFISK